MFDLKIAGLKLVLNKQYLIREKNLISFFKNSLFLVQSILNECNAIIIIFNIMLEIQILNLSYQLIVITNDTIAWILCNESLICGNPLQFIIISSLQSFAVLTEKFLSKKLNIKNTNRNSCRNRNKIIQKISKVHFQRKQRSISAKHRHQ